MALTYLCPLCGRHFDKDGGLAALLKHRKECDEVA